MTKLSWTGFSKKTPQERKEHLKTNALLSQENQDLLDKDQQLTLETANQMAENVIGRFTLPFAICPDVSGAAVPKRAQRCGTGSRAARRVREWRRNHQFHYCT